MLQWMTASTEQMKEDGVRFICRHAEDLGLPYKWSTTMSLLYKSLYDSGFMIALDEARQVRGVLAYIFGTGKDQSADQTRVEIVLLYIDGEARSGTKLVQAIEALLERETELPQPIQEFEFYCPSTDANRRLFGHFATLRDTKMHPCGLLDCYVTMPDRLRQYVASISSRWK